MAKVVRFHKVGGPEVLQLDEVDVAPPKQGEIQIRVKALGKRCQEPFPRSRHTLCAARPARSVD